MKKCPFCAEEVQDEAIKCKYCREVLSAAPPTTEKERGAPFPKRGLAHRLRATARRVTRDAAIILGALFVLCLVGSALQGQKEPARATPSFRRVALAREERGPSQPGDSSSAMDGRIPEPAAPASTKETTAPSVEAPVIPVPPDAEMQDSTAVPARQEQKEVLRYRILEIEDLSSGGIVRLQYRIRVSREPTDQELRAVCTKTIEREKQRRHNGISGISFLFYLPDTDPHGFFTAGKAEWSPDGIWEDAGKAAAGDYRRHKLAVECGNALSDISALPTPGYTSQPSDNSESERRRIFWELVAEQDKNPLDTAWNVAAYGVVARRHGISVWDVREIGFEGARKGWPMPSPPSGLW